MATFGYSSVGASNGNSVARAYGHGNSAQWHTAGATDTITTIHMHTRNIGDTAEVGVYDMGVAGSNPDNATRIAVATITATSGTATWEDVAVNIALTSGHVYFLAYATSNGIRRYFDTGVAGDSTEDLLASGGLLLDPYTEGATDDEIVSLYATFTTGPELSLDSEPSTMAKAETGVQFVVSTPATTPTTGNTTVISLGDALTVTSVTGSDPYTINCTVPLDISKQVDSYVWTITVDAENIQGQPIPLTPQTGWSNITLVSPLTTVGYMLNGYTGDAPVTDDAMEWETTTDLTPGTDSEWVWDTAPTVTQVVARRVIQLDGTVGATEDVTFTVAAGGSFNTLQEWVDSLVTGNSTTDKIMRFLNGAGFSGGMTEMMYEYLKTQSAKNSNSERRKDWADGGFG